MDNRVRDGLVWRKSAASGSGNCVEVAAEEDLVYVRNSKSPHGPAVAFTASEWAAFLHGAQAGEFDVDALRN